MMMSLFQKKDVHALIAKQSHSGLKRDLGTWDLTLLGVGAVVGTGIFVLSGTGAIMAGPGVIISFIIAGLACLFAALTYAEFASTVPVSGSAYTYAYATIGEFFAFLIGWDLISEYLLAVSAVSAGWSGYAQAFLQSIGIHIPTILTGAPGSVPGQTTIFNFPAFFIVMVITLMLSLGVKESKRLNNVMVTIKVLVIVLIIGVGIFHMDPANWKPFIPHGWSKVFSAAALVFFAFLGFDAVSTAAEETKDPAKDLPRGIIYSLLICTGLYILITLIITGLVPAASFAGHEDRPVAFALEAIGQNWLIILVTIGTVLGMMTVILVMLYGLTRIILSISRDGLFPKSLAKMNEKRQVPTRVIWVCGIIAGLVGGLVPLSKIATLVNIGTLAAFVTVSIAVLVLRKTEPDLPRKFKTPFVPLVPILAILSCGYLMLLLGSMTWIFFGIWILLGVIVYFSYSKSHSLLSKENNNGSL
ncbi:amino acid permease [Shimazuella sp. AN120528]|uniref:amino acid permease n=1 Tax=Shimazuella soli TaxID=1892854 RepID=UPI001F0DC5B6|nr:amino acid permease [Shimazuella soli]MCH5585694.1 amino acid permease [Shimazuella soli]